MELTAYLAAEGLTEELLEELAEQGEIGEARGRLILAPGPARRAAWAQNIWHDARFLPVESIGHAAKSLKALQRNWALLPTGHFRRAALIQEKLPPVKARPLAFGEPAPSAPLGSWTLWEPNLLLAATRCSSPFPHGEVHFIEDREGPPNRAYLKLWEVFALSGQRPRAGEVCLDLGGSPGGWSWVLASLGAKVFFVDRSPPAAAVARLPGLDVCLGSAFALQPEAVGPVDWLFWDVACYPERLETFLQRWIETSPTTRVVATVKFQGRPDPASVAALAALPGVELRHLFHNKHELTLTRLTGE